MKVNKLPLLYLLLVSAGCGTTSSKSINWSEYFLGADTIKINQIQLKGTHNSYHLHPPQYVVKDLDYYHSPLTEQFSNKGVRQIELDIHFETATGKFRVFHIPVIDENSTCRYFAECLKEVKKWSDENPWHIPLFIFIEPKDDIDIYRVSSYEPIEGHYQDLENEILSVFSPDRILKPDDVRGDYSTLREAVLNNNWPSLNETRGKVVFIMLDSGKHRFNYTNGGKDLRGKILFVTADSDQPFAAILKMDDPTSNLETIKERVAENFIIRTRADALKEAREKDFSRQETALESGAQIISTDFPVKGMIEDYYFEIPDGAVARCNPINAPQDCSPEDIEREIKLSEHTLITAGLRNF